VHIEDFFHPDAGYQVNILSKYQIMKGHKVTIVTSEIDKLPKSLTTFFDVSNMQKKDKAFEQSTGVKLLRVSLYSFISGRSIYHESIFKTVDNLKPDIVYVHGNDTYIGIRYALKLKRLRYPVIFDNHMLDMASKNKFNILFYFFYRKFVTPKIIESQSTVIRTVDNDFVQRRLGIPVKYSPIIGFGSDLLHFHPNESVKVEMRKKYKINQEDFVVIYAGKLDNSKGGLLLAKAIEKKIKSSRNIVFLLIGTLAGSDKEEIENILHKSENRIIRIGTQPYRELSKFFQCADIAVFAKQCSLTFFDVQACGLPVILEENVINLERVKNNNGVCFKSGDCNDLRNKIQSMANLKKEEYKNMSNASVELIKTQYDYRKKADEYQIILDNAVKNFYSKVKSKH
jgi:glycosyltransferase involved in cell wall biosynthesis